MGLDFDSCGDRYASGDISLYFTVSGSVAVSTTSPRLSGGSFLRISGSGSSIQRALPGGAAATVIWGAAIRFSAAPGTADQMVQIMDASTVQMALRINTDLTISIQRGTVTLATTATALTTNTWHFLEFSSTINDTTGTYALRLNGTDIITAGTGQDTKVTSNASATAVRIIDNGFGNLDIDDFYTIDPASGAYTAFLGDCTVEYIYPGGAGNSTQLSVVGAAANYQAVDELAEDGDTSFVSTSTPGQKDTYALTNLSVTPASVIAVKPILVARKDDAGSSNVCTVIRSGGTDYDGPTTGLGLTYAPISKVYDVDPATSAAWTPTAVNNLEAGVKLVS